MISTETRRHYTNLAREYARNVDLAAPYLKGRGITKQAAYEFGLGYVTEGPNQGRVSIPYWTPNGVVNIKYRATDPEDMPKYKGEAGVAPRMYNAQALLNAAEFCVLTEGELDALCVQSMTGIPAVGYPGTTTFKSQPHFKYCFEGLQVLVVADGDDPGKNAANQVAEAIGMSARVVLLEPGEDSNSFLQMYGVDAYRKKLGL
jgi:DNA primase